MVKYPFPFYVPQCVPSASPPNPLEGGLSCLPCSLCSFSCQRRDFGVCPLSPAQLTGDAQTLPCQGVLCCTAQTLPQHLALPAGSYSTSGTHLHLDICPAALPPAGSLFYWSRTASSARPALLLCPFQCSHLFLPCPLGCHISCGLSGHGNTAAQRSVSTKLQSSSMKMWLGMNN